LIGGRGRERQQRVSVEFMQLDPSYRMRKKIQNYPSCNPQLFTQQKCFREIVQALSFRDDDQLINAAALENRSNCGLFENTDEFGSPFAMLFDDSRQVLSVVPGANNSHMTNIQRRILAETKQSEP